MKRLFDIVFSSFGLIILFPILFVTSIGIFLQDKHSPFYIAKRVGKNNKSFYIIKLRSMIINADLNKVDSTSTNDKRITKLGSYIRKFKLDELSQLINVFIGNMSFVGPRPNVKRETDLYTIEEKKLLNIKPGITDFSSIVFSDEGEILKDFDDPDLAYNQLIRPWKSRLGLLYLANSSFLIDIQIIIITLISLFSRKKALFFLNKLLKKIHSPEILIKISHRKEKLIPFPPPGAKEIVKYRQIN